MYLLQQIYRQFIQMRGKNAIVYVPIVHCFEKPNHFYLHMDATVSESILGNVNVWYRFLKFLYSNMIGPWRVEFIEIDLNTVKSLI